MFCVCDFSMYSLGQKAHHVHTQCLHGCPFFCVPNNRRELLYARAPCLHISVTQSVSAVPPLHASSAVLAEQRKQVIQQSKFLGGDMEHTHLVKGLDYALLQKVG